MTPDQEFEKADGKGWSGISPNVIFIESMKSLGGDQFLVFYGAGDNTIGVAKVTVKIKKNGDKTFYEVVADKH